MNTQILVNGNRNMKHNQINNKTTKMSLEEEKTKLRVREIVLGSIYSLKVTSRQSIKYESENALFLQ